MFHIGQKVICIWHFDDQDGRKQSHPGPYPKKGKVYTIRRYYLDFDGVYGVLLYEVVRSFYNGYGAEVGFVAEGFRPIEERETDISIFTKMLNGENVT